MKNTVCLTSFVLGINLCCAGTGYCYFLHDTTQKAQATGRNVETRSGVKTPGVFSPAPAQPQPVPAQSERAAATPSALPSSAAKETAVSSALKEFSVVPGKASPDTAPRSWNLLPGSLQRQLEDWAGKAGYKGIWRASWDLDMQASATFAGDFQDAINDLFLGLHEAGHPIRLAIYPANKVLEVIDQ